MKVLSVDQMYEADKITVEKQNIDSTMLMERAGTQIFEWLQHRLNGSPVPIKIFCGIGDNGGDGLVLGRLLVESGYHVVVYILNFSDKRSENFLINYARIKEVSKEWPILMKSEANFPILHSEDIIIDAIFGIGLNRSPNGWVKSLIEYINQSNAFKLAIDIPSGLFANAPLNNANAVIKANHTLTFHSPKLAFLLPETASFVSSFDILDIGLNHEFIENVEPIAQLISRVDAQIFYIPRDKFGHKGTYGHALIVGGSYGKIGAAVLATSAAFRVGVGMVTTYLPKCGYPILQSSIPEAMVITDKEEEYLTEISFDFKPTAIGIGIGMGKNVQTVKALKKLFKNQEIPLVIDADAINNISENKELLQLLPKKSILTPHPGELKRLIGPWKNDYEKLEKVKKFSKQYNVVMVVKGAYTTTVYDEKIYINTTGNPGMATAGSGDTLTGIITGLICQGYDILVAAIFGVYLHGRSGDIAVEKMGYESIMAGDIIDNISEAYLDLFSHPELEIAKDTSEKK